MKNRDKLMHFGVCFLTAFISPLFSLGLAVGKEYGDFKSNGNHWCWWDLLADLIGILFAVIIQRIV